MLVSICVTTYKRPQGLKRLLQGIAKLTFSKVVCPHIEVIIIDNDDQGIAAQVCQEFQKDFPWILKTDVEYRRGITYGRNKSLSLADTKTDWIAFIDDDEVPEPNWLDELLWVQKEYQADVVSGTVLPHFIDEEPPAWIVNTGFLQRPRFPTGESRHVALTNNVLVNAEVLQQYNPVFDNRFALTGGEDTHLFMRLHQAGYKIVWADDAMVYDWLPRERTTPKWILERYRHECSTYSLLEKELDPSFKTQFIRALKGTVLILIGIARLPLTMIFGRQEIFKSLMYIYRGTGTFIGLRGLIRQEYRVANTEVDLSTSHAIAK